MTTEATTKNPEEASKSGDGNEVKGSNYEIISGRLVQQASQLREKANGLNERRQKLFGGTELSVAGQVVVRTDNNCVPRDIINIGDRLLFGYNVYIGMKKTTDVDDVFSLHEFTKTEDDFEISALSQDVSENFLGDEKFGSDFNSLYTYYGDARLLRLQRTDTRLLSVFQTGTTLEDVRVLRWALDADDNVQYIDNTGQRDLKEPRQHDFDWRTITRADHVQGRHPHICVRDSVFVDCIGGELNIRVEDNTETGREIYSEPVQDAHQSLGDAEVRYCEIENVILLRILPYRESKWRYFVFNSLTEDVRRIDTIGQSCVTLPEKQGVIFPGGYVLSEGPMREFDIATEGMRFQELIRSANGEDYLYVFYRPGEGNYLLLSYNVIRKEIENPINCHGYSIFNDGTMLVFRLLTDEPTRVHPMQIWKTPYYSDEYAAERPTDTTSRLASLGNPELVRGISDILGLCRMIGELEPTEPVYNALIKSAQTLLDNYFWLGKEEIGDIKSEIKVIISTAELVVEEFIKVREMKKQAERRLGDLEARQQDILRDTRYGDWRELDRFVQGLAQLREQRGRLITLRDVRYVDEKKIDELEKEVVERYDEMTEATGQFLVAEGSLAPYRERIDEIEEQVPTFANTRDGEALLEELDEVNEELTLVTDVVGDLQIEDPTQRTQILESIGQLLGRQNQVRARLRNRIGEIRDQEGRAEFAVQFQLLDQTINSALGLADTPEACDERLTRVLGQLEEMETRFSEFDTYIGKLAEKREDIYEAFESRKQTLLEERQRRAQNIADGAERILTNVRRRAASQGSVEELNSFFASDPMIMRVRDQLQRLRDLGENILADDLQTRFSQVQDESVRELRDKVDLYGDDDDVIKLGRHKFSIGSNRAEMTAVPRRGEMMLHITGTEFFEPVEDEDFEETREFWEQSLVSETDHVYRAEYLAASILFNAEDGRGKWSIADLRQKAREEEGLQKVIDAARADRYDEGYERGVHDQDAARILEAVLGVYKTAGLLRFTPQARAAASLFWAFCGDDRRDVWARRAVSLGRLRKTFEHGTPLMTFGDELGLAIDEFIEREELRRPAVAHEDGHHVGLFTKARCREAGHYLAEELVNDDPVFVVNSESTRLRDAFMDRLERKGSRLDFDQDLEKLKDNLSARYDLVDAWLQGFIDVEIEDDVGHVLPEAVGMLLTGDSLKHKVSEVKTRLKVDDMIGQHPLIQGGELEFRLDAFLTRLRQYIEEHVPAWRAYRRKTHELVERERRRLEVDELEPQVMSGFVRNQLINDVYLPLVGDNLATQMGTAGETTRANRSGLLFLISPPGYGKTTLMEYVASRLGVMFVRVNGPSLGYGVTSFDPAEAPSATARQEVERLNFAFEMANNVMLYVDDVQHVSAEFMQQFISLCDATRRVDGVWNGEPKTYDLRGKRFSVVMGGNPYTESGERFRIPDMLANRADIYNLGDILSGNRQAFERSYIENALTSNDATAPLVGREPADVGRFIRMAEGEQIPLTEMAYDYSAVEGNQIVEVLKKYIQVRDVVLKVNQQYIASAGQNEDYRTEPPFLLQGSYRNMGRLAERLVSAMNSEEVELLIDDHYQNEAQTLTIGSEQNLLKLAELRGRMSEEQKERWEEVKREFNRRRMMGGGDDDPVARVAGPLATLVQRMEDIQGSLSRRDTAEHLGEIRDALAEMARSAGSLQTVEKANGKPEAIDVEEVGRAADIADRITDALKNGELRVQIGGEMPEKLEQVLQTQLGLIESALVPLARAIHRHFEQKGENSEKLSEVLKRLENMDVSGP